MRLHQLTATAFGPFADAVSVDFDALAAAGLFLLHGPTGAGKTSILDAVCFALYGQVPGARQQARWLRSDHAPRGMRPEVRLEVTLRGRRFRITRSPTWARPKHRGDGTTTEQARVLVEELEGDLLGNCWVTRATRLDESGLLLDGLLGLGREQFCQVVLLPQGQFAEFLRADADRRRDLLETLFGTKRFTAVERWLVEQRQAVARALDAADQAVAAVVARAEEAAGVDHETAGPTPDASVAWLSDLVAAARDQIGLAAAELEAATGQRTTADAALAAARRAIDLLARHQTLVDRLAAVASTQAARDRAVEQLQAARQVAPVLPLLTEVARLQTDFETVRVRAEATHVGLADYLAATGTGGVGRSSAAVPAAAPRGPAARLSALPDPGDVSRSAAAARAEVGALRQLAGQEAEADLLRCAVDALEQTVVSLQTDAERVARWLDAASERRAELVGQRERAQASAAALPMAQDALDQAVARRAAAARRDQLVIDARKAGDAWRDAADVAQQATERWLGLRQRRLDGMAAELAAGLTVGEPCPVCGSAAHPAPAQGEPDRVTPDAEDLALDASDAAKVHRDRARDELAALEQALAEARHSAGGDTSLDELAADELVERERLDGLTAAAAALTEASEAVAAFDQQREAQVREQVRVAEQLDSARGLAIDRLDRLRLLTALIDDAKGDDASIAARAARIEAAADQCDRLAHQASELLRLQDAVAGALARAHDAAAERDLASLVEAEAAALADDEMSRLDAFRARHDAERATVTELLADPELAGVADLEPSDLASVEDAAARAESRHTAAVAHHAAAVERVSALTRLASTLAAAMAMRAPLAERYQVLDALARLAEGKSADNRLRMSLSGYVLAARLEQVAVAAGERLARMSSGRYTLVHRADAGTGRSRGGLTLRIVDAWTGTERDTTTLSGGESFFASLALALGLADVVVAEAGGTLLETLFVDEGFGSLDDESLDEVMGVLDGLRDGGRLVGVVSHVADLRQRIPAQLVVHKGRHGSTVSQ